MFLNDGVQKASAVVGVAGGNGLEAIDVSVTKRIVGVDINQQYLDAVEQRFGTLAGLELHRCDLAIESPEVGPAARVHAALLFEHTGLGLTLDNVLSLLAPRGILSVVLQLPSVKANDVAITKYTSLQAVKQQFALIDVAGFRLEMASRLSGDARRQAAVARRKSVLARRLCKAGLTGDEVCGGAADHRSTGSLESQAALSRDVMQVGLNPPVRVPRTRASTAFHSGIFDESLLLARVALGYEVRKVGRDC